MFGQRDIFVIWTPNRVPHQSNCTHVIFYSSDTELVELYCSDDMGLEIDEAIELSEA